MRRLAERGACVLPVATLDSPFIAPIPGLET